VREDAAERLGLGRRTVSFLLGGEALGIGGARRILLLFLAGSLGRFATAPGTR